MYCVTLVLTLFFFFFFFFYNDTIIYMGPSSNPNAVVDDRLKVHGVDRLRVVDASVMPKVIAGMWKERMGKRK
jgi:hypothetical protein